MGVTGQLRSSSPLPQLTNWQCSCILRTLDLFGLPRTILEQKLLNESLEKCKEKTTELQNLDSQPTFGNMLERCSKVQFNLNAKQRLDSAGANVKATNKRKNIAFAFKERKHISNYRYPDDFQRFRAAQVRAHRKGVEHGQALFSKYMPEHV